MIREARVEDLGAVRAIVREVVGEMSAEGNFQWDETYPDEARFLRDIENAALYVVEEEGEVLGFAAADGDEPEGYRGLPWSYSGEALVIHRLAVARRSRSLGLASRLEAFLCVLAQERGMGLVKVDTYSTNLGMQAFLSKKGYRKVGEMTFRGKPLPFFCYEKRV